MFIYESDNSLNLTFKGSIPVDNPDIIIKGYKDGATLTVNNTVFGKGNEEFEGRAKTLVYQKDGKLVITFRGIEGMLNPEVTIDEIETNKYTAVVGDSSVTLSITDDKVTIDDSESTQTEVEGPASNEPTVTEDENPTVEPEDEPEETIEPEAE